MTDRSQGSLEILTKARELLSDPEHWTRDALARDIEGNKVIETAKAAVCFCVLGALCRSASAKGLNFNELHLASDLIRNVTGNPSIGAFNDAEETTHADVLTAFDKAIALAAQSQGSAAAGPHLSSPSAGL